MLRTFAKAESLGTFFHKPYPSGIHLSQKTCHKDKNVEETLYSIHKSRENVLT